MGRLWQSLLLGQYHPVFEHLPVENLVFANQQAYYDAITVSNRQGESTVFIEFMLTEILETLKAHRGEELKTEIDGVKYLSSFAQTFTESFARVFARIFTRTVGKEIKTLSNREKAFEAMQQVLVLVKTKDAVNAKMLSAAVGVSERTMRTYLKQLTEAKVLTYAGTTNNGKWNIILKAKSSE